MTTCESEAYVTKTRLVNYKIAKITKALSRVYSNSYSVAIYVHLAPAVTALVTTQSFTLPLRPEKTLHTDFTGEIPAQARALRHTGLRGYQVLHLCIQ